MSERKYIPHPSHGELFYPDESPFNLAGELLDTGITPEGEARRDAQANADAKRAQIQFCERCGQPMQSSLPHCATCHRELWSR